VDGSEELCDHRADPSEWTNLAVNPQHAAIITEHRRWLPKIDVPLAANSSNRVLTYDKMTDEAVWEGNLFHRSDSLPEYVRQSDDQHLASRLADRASGAHRSPGIGG
jgi:hypothetical protein